MSEKKMTNEVAFKTIKEILSTDPDANAELITFVDGKIAQLARAKEYSKEHPVAKKVDPEVEARRAKVLSAVTDEGQTAKEIGEKCGVTGAQASGALRSLETAGSVKSEKPEGAKAKIYTLA